MQTIERKFEAIFKYMGIPKEELRPEVSFKQDLEFEEFQFGYLVFYVGSYFRINIRESDYAELSTIGSTMDFVKRETRRSNNLKISLRKIRSLKTLKSIPRNIPPLVDQRTIPLLTHLTYQPLALNVSSK